MALENRFFTFLKVSWVKYSKNAMKTVEGKNFVFRNLMGFPFVGSQ